MPTPHPYIVIPSLGNEPLVIHKSPAPRHYSEVHIDDDTAALLLILALARRQALGTLVIDPVTGFKLCVDGRVDVPARFAAKLTAVNSGAMDTHWQSVRNINSSIPTSFLEQQGSQWRLSLPPDQIGFSPMFFHGSFHTNTGVLNIEMYPITISGSNVSAQHGKTIHTTLFNGNITFTPLPILPSVVTINGAAGSDAIRFMNQNPAGLVYTDLLRSELQACTTLNAIQARIGTPTRERQFRARLKADFDVEMQHNIDPLANMPNMSLELQRRVELSFDKQINEWIDILKKLLAYTLASRSVSVAIQWQKAGSPVHKLYGKAAKLEDNHLGSTYRENLKTIALGTLTLRDYLRSKGLYSFCKNTENWAATKNGHPIANFPKPIFLYWPIDFELYEDNDKKCVLPFYIIVNQNGVIGGTLTQTPPQGYGNLSVAAYTYKSNNNQPDFRVNGQPAGIAANQTANMNNAIFTNRLSAPPPLAVKPNAALSIAPNQGAIGGYWMVEK